MTDETIVRLSDQWHPEGHKVRVRLTDGGAIPAQIQMALRVQDRRIDPMTRVRDLSPGQYVRDGDFEGDPLFVWQPDP